MRLILITAACGALIASGLAGQAPADSTRRPGGPPGVIEPVSGRRVFLENAQDSATFFGRTRPDRSAYTDCVPHAFQTCASEEIEARLAADGMSYGVLIIRQHDRFNMFVWQIPPKPGRPSGGGAPGRGRRQP